MSAPNEATAAAGELAITLGGGGARGAYQVGVLRHVARLLPDLQVPIVTGVSAGGINAAMLASHPGAFAARVEELVKLWSELSVDQVFRVDRSSLARHAFGFFGQIALLGGRRGMPQMRGMVDTTPLRELLERALAGPDGTLRGMHANLVADRVRALALSTTCYGTGQTVTFCQGRDLSLWERPQRISVEVELRVEHVLASSALPLFFPAVQIENAWYGDGGIRLHSPFAPAIHLGAQRVLAVSTRYGRTAKEAAETAVVGYPPPALVLGVLLNAIFLDMLDQDAALLERINRLLPFVPPAERGNLRPVEILVIRPSVDLGRLANAYEPRLPGLFRFLTRRLGTRDSKNLDAISLVMFQEDYLRHLIELGEKDAAAREDELVAFLAR